MSRLLLTSSFVLLLTTSLLAQSAQVTWDQSSVASSAQAQGFTYKLYVTPAGTSTVNPPVTLASVLCGGTAPNVQCSTVLPASASAANITGAKSTITATGSDGTESAQSSPFSKPTAVPTNLKITP